jgi:hypothetical protein
MATTFQVIGDGASFRLAGTPAETEYYNYADDGTSTGLSVISEGTFTTAQADPDGGNNAILYTCGNLGAGRANGIQVTTFNYTNAGVNKFRFKYKKNTWASALSRLRVKLSNMTTNPVGYVNMDDNTWTTESSWTSASITSLGSSWYLVELTRDQTSDSDRIGAFQIYFGDANADQTITANADHSVYFYQVKASY